MSKTRTSHFRHGKESTTLFAATCAETGKRIYLSRGRARTARQRLGDRTIGIYRCGHCNGYHLGHLHPDVIAGERSRAEAYS